MPHDQRIQLCLKWTQLCNESLLEDLRAAMSEHDTARRALQVRQAWHHSCETFWVLQCSQPASVPAHAGEMPAAVVEAHAGCQLRGCTLFWLSCIDVS